MKYLLGIVLGGIGGGIGLIFGGVGAGVGGVGGYAAGHGLGAKLEKIVKLKYERIESERAERKPFLPKFELRKSLTTLQTNVVSLFKKDERKKESATELSSTMPSQEEENKEEEVKR